MSFCLNTNQQMALLGHIKHQTSVCLYKMVKLNVQEGHAHVVFVILPRIAVADAIRFIKTKSAKKLRAIFIFIQKTYAGKDDIWSKGYRVSCIG